MSGDALGFNICVPSSIYPPSDPPSGTSPAGRRFEAPPRWYAESQGAWSRLGLRWAAGLDGDNAAVMGYAADELVSARVGGWCRQTRTSRPLMITGAVVLGAGLRPRRRPRCSTPLTRATRT